VLTIQHSGSGSLGGTLRLRTWLDDADASSMVASVADVEGRTLTSASTATILTESDGSIEIDVTAAIQEVVDRAGYAGGAIGIATKDDGSDTDIRVQAKFYDESPSVAASIFICVQEESSQSSPSSLSSSSTSSLSSSSSSSLSSQSSSSTSSQSTSSSSSSFLRALSVVSADNTRVGLQSSSNARTGLDSADNARAGLQSSSNARA